MSKYNKEELEKYIFEDKLSYIAIGKIYGVSDAAIRKAAKRLGIELPQRRKINEKETFNKGTGKKKLCKNCGKDISHKGQNIYCDINCQHEYQSKEKYEYFLTSPEEFQRANFSTKAVKKFILEEQNNKCAICGMDNIWNDLPLVFILDHIDGNAANNTRENFRCICPNCDSQLDTYKSKNKNGARHYYRYHKEKSQ